MPDCFSCDCTPVSIYDANRVAPGAATQNERFDNIELVVDWMNQNRDFFSFEHNLIGKGDSYGPHQMQTSGTWVFFEGFSPPPASNPNVPVTLPDDADPYEILEITLEDLEGLTASERLDFVVDKLRAVENEATRAELAELIFGSAAEDVLELVNAANDLSPEQASGRAGVGGGLAIFSDVPAYQYALETKVFAAGVNQGATTCGVFGELWQYRAYELSTTPADNPVVFWFNRPLVGIQFRQFTITAFETTRSVREDSPINPGEPIFTSVYTPFDYELNPESFLHICVHRQSTSKISLFGFPDYTGQINRPEEWTNVGVRSGGGEFVRIGYFNAPVEIRSSGRVVVTRDGVPVLSAIRPTLEQCLFATQLDGTYFVTSYVDETTDTASNLPYRRRYPRPLKQFASFVVDRVAPVFGYSAINDVYEGFDLNFFRDDSQHYNCTKPGVIKYPNSEDVVVVFEHIKQQYVSPSDDGTNTPPNPYFNSFNEFGKFLYPVDTPGIFFFPRPLIADKLDSEPLDRAGNLAEYYPQTYTVHAMPANGHLGAIPSIQDPSSQTRPIGRARYQHETVSRLALVFDREVDPETVEDSQVTLYKNGAVVAGCTLEKTGVREWDIVLPESADQSSRSFWLLEYDPGGQVLTADVRVEKYPPGFNLPEEGRYRIIYEQTTSDGTTTRYSWSEQGYIDIGDDQYPKDENGVDYDPEPCVIAARVSWLMADFDGWRRPLDCSATTVELPGTASMSIAREELREFTDELLTVLSNEAYSALPFVAEQIEENATSQQSNSGQSGSASETQSIPDGVDPFEFLEITFDDLKDLTTEERLQLVVEKLRTVEDLELRTQLAESIFGPLAEDVLQLVEAGDIPVEDLLAQAQELGLLFENVGKQSVIFACNGYSTLELTEPWGQFYRSESQDGFTPHVPYGLAAPANCSYFGLTTTIDPCPPALLHCPVPSAAQPHASLVRSLEFTQIVVQFFFNVNDVPEPFQMFFETTLNNIHPAIPNTLSSQNSFFGVIEEQEEAEVGNFFPSTDDVYYPGGPPFSYLAVNQFGESLRNSGLYLNRQISGGYHLLQFQRNADQYTSLKTAVLHELQFQLFTTLTHLLFTRNPEQPFTNIAYAGEFESDILASNLINETPGVIYKSLDVLGVNFGKFLTWKEGEGFVETESELGPAYGPNGQVLEPIETPESVIQYVFERGQDIVQHTFSEEQEQALAAGEIVRFGVSSDSSDVTPDFLLQAIFE